jgi:hypothetical protein
MSYFNPNNTQQFAGTQGLQSFVNDSLSLYNNNFSGLASVVNGPDVDQMRRDAGARADAAFDGTAAMQARARTATDMGTLPGQVDSDNRRISLARAIANADAQNRAIVSGRKLTQSAQDQAFGLFNEDRAQAGRLYGQVASEESGRAATYEQGMYASKAGAWGLAGQVIGLASGAYQ